MFLGGLVSVPVYLNSYRSFLKGDSHQKVIYVIANLYYIT